MSLIVLSGTYMNIFVKLYFSLVAVLHQRVFIIFLGFFAVVVTFFFFFCFPTSYTFVCSKEDA